MPKSKDGCFATYLVTTGVPLKYYARPHIPRGILYSIAPVGNCHGTMKNNAVIYRKLQDYKL